MSMVGRLCLALLLLPGASSCTADAADDLPALGRQTYSLDLSRDVTPAAFGRAYPGLATWGNFAAEPDAHRRKIKLPQSILVESRKFGFTVNVDIDNDYCPGALTPDVKGGALRITAYRLPPDQVPTCGQGRKWASALITSQPSFAQTYGYFEIDAKLPCDPGRWPAFWLLPVSKTKENGGRLAEIDVFEHYGGPRVLHSRNGVIGVDNRVGQPFSTLHYGTQGNETSLGNVKSLPKLSDGERQAFCAARHRFGVLWTPQQFRFFIDRRETFATPNPGVSDPHYWVLNMDVSTNAGDMESAPDPSHFLIYSVRAWALARSS